ncbi:MAG TPA: 30S ribosomal protein S6 [Phycisphaerales bacterium]|nr:30S ribosomal protein S6 [Phycisphaerales bacterium]
MAEIRTNTYEAMFLLGQAQAADLGGAVAHIREVLGKAGATIVAMRKWDERRLAFEIQKQKRGVYILVYFTCNARNLAQIERSFNLSERVLRHLIIRADHLTPEEIQAADSQKELEVEARLRAERAVGRPEDGTAPAGPPMGAASGAGAATAPHTSDLPA